MNIDGFVSGGSNGENSEKKISSGKELEQDTEKESDASDEPNNGKKDKTSSLAGDSDSDYIIFSLRLLNLTYVLCKFAFTLINQKSICW